MEGPKYWAEHQWRLRGTVNYEVLIIIVVINAIATLSLWRKIASKSNRGPELNKKAATALWHSDTIVPKHKPQHCIVFKQNGHCFAAPATLRKIIASCANAGAKTTKRIWLVIVRS
jgi:hypothetical protein